MMTTRTSKIYDPELADREEKHLDGNLRKVVVYGKLGTYRVVYTARTLGKTIGGRSHIYQGERIVPIKGADLAEVTASDELYEIMGLARMTPHADEIYFEDLELALKYIDEKLPSIKAEHHASRR